MARISIKLCLISSIVLLLSACSIKPTHTSLQQADLPDLIPIRDFVANIESVSNFKISPDGKKLAWKGTSGLQQAIFIRHHGKKRIINVPPKSRGLVWSQDSNSLFIFMDDQGRENTHIFKISLDDEEPKPIDITPWKGAKVILVKRPLWGTDHIYIKVNNRNRSYFDLYRLNHKTGKKTLLEQNDGSITQWGIDEKGQLRYRFRVSHKQKKHYMDVRQGKSWRTIANWKLMESLWVVAMPEHNKSFIVASNRGRDKIAVAQLLLTDGSEKIIYAHNKVDISQILTSKSKQSVVAIKSIPDYPELKIYDESLHKLIAPLLSGEKANINVDSVSADENLYTFRLTNTKGANYYLLNRLTGKMELLGVSGSMQFADKLVKTKPVSLKSRDGLELNGYLTMPNIKPAKKLPTVLLVHGGPWLRDYWGYGRLTQMLANRGYAVMKVNYRGSRGYGKKFMQAAMGEFAGKMHDDLIDTVDWLVKKGISDPKKIAIVGFSYGGYAAHVGMTFTPDRFACGVAGVGFTDLESLIRQFPPYWEQYIYHWHTFVGNPDKAEDRRQMRAKSPLYKANQLKNPLLVIQTTNDVRVTQDQSDRMVDALKKLNKPVEYVLFKGEGHGLRHWKNRLKMYRATEDFLAKCLGGRSSGFDFYQLGTWMF